MFKKGDKIVDIRTNKVGEIIEYDRFGQFALIVFDEETEEKPVSSEYIRLTKLQKTTDNANVENNKRKQLLQKIEKAQERG